MIQLIIKKKKSHLNYAAFANMLDYTTKNSIAHWLETQAMLSLVGIIGFSVHNMQAVVWYSTIRKYAKVCDALMFEVQKYNWNYVNRTSL